MTGQLRFKGRYTEDVRGIPLELEFDLSEESFTEQIEVMRKNAEEMRRIANNLADIRDAKRSGWKKRVGRHRHRRWNRVARLWALWDLRYLFEEVKR